MKTLLPLLAVFLFADVVPSGCGSKSSRPAPPPDKKTSAVHAPGARPS